MKRLLIISLVVITAYLLGLHDGYQEGFMHGKRAEAINQMIERGTPLKEIPQQMENRD